MQVAPLSQALQADQVRLALYADPKDPTKALPEHQAEYDATMARMENTMARCAPCLDIQRLTRTCKSPAHWARFILTDSAVSESEQADGRGVRSRSTADGVTLPAQKEAFERTQIAPNMQANVDAIGQVLTKAGVDPKIIQEAQAVAGGAPAGAFRPEAENWQQVDLKFKDGTTRTVERNSKNGMYRLPGHKEEMTQSELDGATSVPKPGHAPTPKAGVSEGKNVFAVLTDQGWVDAGTKAPLKDFRPAPSFAQTGLYGVDMVQNADGTIGSALLNRRTGQFKPITAQGGTPIAPALMAQVTKSLEPALESDTRFRVMKDAEKDALDGNQQAMLNIVANHMGMTLGQQKGTRINQSQWNEAIASAPWVETKAAQWFHTDENGDHVFDGYKGGVNITPQQIYQMVDLAVTRRKRQWQQAQQACSFYGVNVPVPPDLEHPSSTLEGPKADHSAMEAANTSTPKTCKVKFTVQKRERSCRKDGV